MCSALGVIEAAAVVDHIRQHKGDMALFWDGSNLQSLCKRHHDSDVQSVEKGGKIRQQIGLDGWPSETDSAISEMLKNKSGR